MRDPEQQLLGLPLPLGDGLPPLGQRKDFGAVFSVRRGLARVPGEAGAEAGRCHRCGARAQAGIALSPARPEGPARGRNGLPRAEPLRPQDVRAWCRRAGGVRGPSGAQPRGGAGTQRFPQSRARNVAPRAGRPERVRPGGGGGGP